MDERLVKWENIQYNLLLTTVNVLAGALEKLKQSQLIRSLVMQVIPVR